MSGTGEAYATHRCLCLTINNDPDRIRQHPHVFEGITVDHHRHRISDVIKDILLILTSYLVRLPKIASKADYRFHTPQSQVGLFAI